jgi:Arc/MetJ family transcription regulator
MRTNIVIDDKLMADVMAYGDFKTKREAVEEGLRMLKRKKAYAAIRAARGTLFWDDSEEAWAKHRAELAAQVVEQAAEQTTTATVQEPSAPYTSGTPR